MSDADRRPVRWTRDYVFDILKELGIHHIFGVPGTNEIPIIDGTSYAENQVRYVECLHENIAIGAAMGNARMTGKPGVLVVHITPGIAHTIGNLFNAWRSQIPLVILCCQQQNELVTQEPLLASDLVDLAAQYTKWAHEVRAPEEMKLVLQRAFKEAMAPPNGPVFVAIPWEFTIRAIPPDDKVKGVTRISPHFTGDPAAIAEAARHLAQSKSPIIVAGDAVGTSGAWPELQELAELLGAPVLLQTFSSVANFPNDDPHWQGELPGDQQGLQQVFAQHDTAFLVGFHAQAQVTVFKYSDGPLIPDSVKQIYLTNNTWDLGKNYYGETAIFGDVKATLPLLNERVRQNPPAGADERNRRLAELAGKRRAEWAAYLKEAHEQEDIWAVTIAEALRKEIAERGLEKKFVYVHEAVSDPAPFQYLLPLDTRAAEPISYYCVAGGSLGWSMPASLGIKSEPEGRQGIRTELVINAVGDGSSLFYPQSWWTTSRDSLAVLYIITNNQEYHTLQLGLQSVVQAYAGPAYGWKPKDPDPEYLKLNRPELDFAAICKAFGGGGGEVVEGPENVAAAVCRGIDVVLKDKVSYVLDMRTAHNPPAPPSLDLDDEASRKAFIAERADRYLARYRQQPPLDVFHDRGSEAGLEGEEPAAYPNVPVIV